MKRSDADGFSAEPVSRENLWCMETPQVFETALLKDAYAAVRDRGLIVTDEVSAVQAIGVPREIHRVPASQSQNHHARGSRAGGGPLNTKS